MNIQVDPTRSNLASAMMNSKIRPRAVVVYGVKIFPPSPPNYVTNRLSYACFFFYEVNLIIWAYFRLFSLFSLISKQPCVDATVGGIDVMRPWERYSSY